MPKSSKQELKTKAAYNKRPDVQAKRVANNKARREALREGRVHKGDGKDVAHRRALQNGGTNTASNLEIQSRKKNRGWRKGQKGYKVPNG